MSGYKKLFENLDVFKPESPVDLDKLAQFMTRSLKFNAPPDPEPDEADAPPHIQPTTMLTILKSLNNDFLNFETLTLLDENLLDSKIPAGYAYLGQFILHDISFDSRSNRFNRSHYPWNPSTEQVTNLHRPFLDLENLYGSANVPESRWLVENSSRLKLGRTLSSAEFGKSFPNDLLRATDSVKADVADSRNDENLLLAQTQVAFTKFHNAIVYKLGNPGSTAVFEKARKMTTWHYQYIILTDFLPRFVKGGLANGGREMVEKIISEVRSGKNKLFNPIEGEIFVPLEFAVGAHRTGHSMLRHTYNLNKEFNKQKAATLIDIMLFTGRGKMRADDKTEEKVRISLPGRWVVNWKWFYNIDNSQSTEENFNFARSIDTTLSSTLGILFPGARTKKANSLAALDLYRGVERGLPSGQAFVGRLAEMHPEITILTSAEIEKKLDKSPTPDQPSFTVLDANQRKYFAENTPLLLYLLAEAEEQCGGQTLGDAGSRIVAETLVKLIYETPDSILKKGLEEFKSSADFLLNDNKVLEMLKTEDTETFGMAEMLKFVAASRKAFAVTPEEDFDELNPLG